ncbi:MAG: DUF3516 domain-containing protein [Coriobacteriia bacterium]|nr:DUF3516 domain-containing protein [Coriobacteriia bacterium]
MADEYGQEYDSMKAPLEALADELWSHDADPTEDDVFEAFASWAADEGKELWPHQEEAVLSLMMGEHVILGTPTGSGKSLVAQSLLFKALCLGSGRAYYTAPIKALVNEKYFDMCDAFGQSNVGMITGDIVVNPEAPIVCCTAEILAMDSLRWEGADNAEYVVMDEFHFFGDIDRGWAWQVPLLALTNVQYLLMSATLGDMTRVKELIEERTGGSVSLVTDAPRPVPLAFEYVETPLESTVELALREGKDPLYIVHFSQRAALESARHLASFGVADKEQRQAVKDACKGFDFSTAFGQALQRLLGLGVGVHHAGMLPRYRLLVEKLSQQGLLRVICGTDTLGVGINVPIHTVLVTSLTKYDGRKQRRLKAREFHQIAGRAGRAGFDTEGDVLVQAPDYAIENARLRAKCGGDEKKLRKLKLKQPRPGMVTWNKAAYDKLVVSPPEALRPRMKVTHAMVLALAQRGGDVRAHMADLIALSLQSDEEKAALVAQANEIVDILVNAQVLGVERLDDGADDYYVAAELPEDLALDQPLSPFLLAAIELLDPEDDDYTLDLISLAESIAENPRQLLYAQERAAKARAIAEMKASGVPYEERVEKVEEVTYPKPLEDLLTGAFAMYCEEVPWALDYEIAPKSVLREIVEGGHTFKSYVAAYKIADSEGTLLRYLADVYRILDRTIPYSKCTDLLEEVISWLHMTVIGTDRSLFEDWSTVGEPAEDVAAPGAVAVVADRKGLTLLVRNALFARVKLMAAPGLAAQARTSTLLLDGFEVESEEAEIASEDLAESAASLGELDAEWGFGERAWREMLERFYDEHELLRADADARSSAYFELDTANEEDAHVWHVRQLLLDDAGDLDFRIEADLDLDASQQRAEAVFKNYQVFCLD